MWEDIVIIWNVYQAEAAAWIAIAFMAFALFGFIFGHFHAEYIDTKQIREDEYLLSVERKKLEEKRFQLEQGKV